MDSDFDLGATIRGLAANDRVFDRYVLQRILGRGAMGVVWLATDETLDRPVALKFLPHMICLDEAMLEELKEEARRSLELTHQSIVRIYDIAHDHEYAAISMEYIEGKPLSAIRAGKEHGFMEATELEPILEQLIAALSYAHQSAKVVHRDLKPANVLMTDAGIVKLADFGISRSISDTVSRISIQRSSSGTLAYMSPQQALGKVPSVEDDIYSLAAMVYDLLTSKPPFHSGDVITQIERVSPPPMAERRRELGLSGDSIPASWEAAVARALSKDSEDRYPSVDDFWRDVRNEKPPKKRWNQPQVATAVAPASSPSVPANPTASAAYSPKKKKPAALVAGISAATLAVAGIGYALYARQQVAEMKTELLAAVSAAKSAGQPAAKVQLLEEFLTENEQSSLPAFLTSATLQEARDELETYKKQALTAQQELRAESARQHQEILSEQERLGKIQPQTLEQFASLEADLEALSQRVAAFDDPDYADGLVALKEQLEQRIQTAQEGAGELRRAEGERRRKHLVELQALDSELASFEKRERVASAAAMDGRQNELQGLAKKLQAFAKHADTDPADGKALLERLGKLQQALGEQQTLLAEAKAKVEAAAKAAEEAEKNAAEAAKPQPKDDVEVAAAPTTEPKMPAPAAPTEKGDAVAAADTPEAGAKPPAEAPTPPAKAADPKTEVMASNSPPPAGAPASPADSGQSDSGAIEFPTGTAASAKEPPPPIKSTKELFDQSKYSDYGSYGKKRILQDVQTKLKKEGLYSSGIDGVPGPGTHRAITSYQEKAGLPVTGKLSDQLLARMNLQDQPDRQAPAPKPRPSPSRTKPKPTTPSVTKSSAPKPPPSNGVQSGLAPLRTGDDPRLK